jgi:hypothetical protein
VQGEGSGESLGSVCLAPGGLLSFGVRCSRGAKAERRKGSSKEQEGASQPALVSGICQPASQPARLWLRRSSLSAWLTGPPWLNCPAAPLPDGGKLQDAELQCKGHGVSVPLAWQHSGTRAGTPPGSFASEASWPPSAIIIIIIRPSPRLASAVPVPSIVRSPLTPSFLNFPIYICTNHIWHI